MTPMEMRGGEGPGRPGKRGGYKIKPGGRGKTGPFWGFKEGMGDERTKKGAKKINLMRKEDRDDGRGRF